jgi:hypothetical protein
MPWRKLVIDAIEGSRYVWRPVEAISRDTGIPLDRVRQILNSTSRDVITAPRPNAQGAVVKYFPKSTGWVGSPFGVDQE